jgi:hypothetical protein
MGIVLDILGSLAIRGAIVLVILRLNLSLYETLYLKTASANVRKIMDEMSTIIETDFHHAGYNVSGPAFVQYDSSSVMFLGDQANTGTIDTIRLYLSGTSVYRRVNSLNAVCLSDNVAEFRLDYFNPMGETAASESEIRSIRLKMAMQESYTITLSSDGQTHHPWARTEYQYYPPNL